MADPGMKILCRVGSGTRRNRCWVRSLLYLIYRGADSANGTARLSPGDDQVAVAVSVPSGVSISSTKYVLRSVHMMHLLSCLVSTRRRCTQGRLANLSPYKIRRLVRVVDTHQLVKVPRSLNLNEVRRIIAVILGYVNNL